MKKNKVIIFETIRFLYWPLVKYYLFRGYEVIALLSVHRSRSPRWALKMMVKGQIKRAIFSTISAIDGAAIDQSEIIYPRLNNKPAYIISGLYDSEEVDAIFKKSLVISLYHCMYINEYLFDKQKKSGDGINIVFLPEAYNKYLQIIEAYGSYSLKNTEQIVTPGWFKGCTAVFLIIDKLKYLFMLGCYFVFLRCAAVINFFTSRKVQRISYNYAIPIIQLFQIKFKGKRGFDFLLDKRILTRQNTVFLPYLGMDKEWLCRRKREGYNFFSLRDMDLLKSLFVFRLDCSFINKVCAAIALLIAIRGLTKDADDAALTGIRMFVNWQLFIQQIGFDNYIYSNNESVQQIAFNILARRQGVKTWNYSSFIGGGVLYSRNGEFINQRQIAWSYLNSDYALFINNDVISYNKLHRQTVRNYLNIGCLYSELIKETAAEISRTDYITQNFKTVPGGNTKIISFFDTSFIPLDEEVPGCILTYYEDGYNFYHDILKLLQERQDLLLIIKPSKSASFFISYRDVWALSGKGSEIMRSWKSLNNHPRVFWAGDNGDPITIMAVSDLVVTHCMSSPTAEALGARKKAIWYESGDKHKRLIYDKIPFLCSHGYKELIKNIDYFLQQLSDKEYDDYLERYIKGKVESSLEGDALTRFRQLLLR